MPPYKCKTDSAFILYDKNMELVCHCSMHVFVLLPSYSINVENQSYTVQQLYTAHVVVHGFTI